MDPPLRPAPDAEGEPAHDPADRGDGVHGPEDDDVVPCAGENHRRDDDEPEGEDEIDQEEDELQPEEAPSGGDVPEPVEALGEQAPTGLPSRLRDRGLRDVDEEEDGDSDHERDDVDRHDRGDPEAEPKDPEERGGEDRREDPGDRLGGGQHPARPPVLGLREHRGDRGGVRGPLERLERALEGPEDEPVPHLEGAGEIEEQQDDRPDPRGEVAEHHRELPVPPVHEGPCDRAQDHRGGEAEERSEGEGRRLVGLEVRPDHEGEARHPRAEEGERLARADEGERPHPPEAGSLLGDRFRARVQTAYLPGAPGYGLTG